MPLHSSTGIVNTSNDFFFGIIKVSLKNVVERFFFVINTKRSIIQRVKNLEANRKKPNQLSQVMG